MFTGPPAARNIFNMLEQKGYEQELQVIIQTVGCLVGGSVKGFGLQHSLPSGAQLRYIKPLRRRMPVIIYRVHELNLCWRQGDYALAVFRLKALARFPHFSFHQKIHGIISFSRVIKGLKRDFLR